MSEKTSSNSNQGKKKSWTQDEDNYLIKLVQKYGAQKWTTIAENLPGNSITIKAVLASNAVKGGTTT
jgi:hypothetical protein